MTTLIRPSSDHDMLVQIWEKLYLPTSATGLRPTYYVKHPNGNYSEADPQPYFDYEQVHGCAPMAFVVDRSAAQREKGEHDGK
jgi:hypothetical protein